MREERNEGKESRKREVGEEREIIRKGERGKGREEGGKILMSLTHTHTTHTYTITFST